MDYNHSFDHNSREHDSGYFTPSPDKDNKITDSNVSYKGKLELASSIKKSITNSIYNISENTQNNNANSSNNSSSSTSSNNLTHNSANSSNLSFISENKNYNPNTNLISNTVNPALNEVDRPPHSYIALISMAILSKPERKILLNEIYDWVISHFPYYQYRTDKSWRNSIRHNLSLNECFIKVGKAGNGRGYYWSIHGANMVDFKKGDFRRRQARLRAKHDKTSSSKNSENSSKNSSKKISHSQIPSNPHNELGNSNLSVNNSTVPNQAVSQYHKSFSNPAVNQNYTIQGSNQNYTYPINSQQGLSLITNNNSQETYSHLMNHISPQSGQNSTYHNLQNNYVPYVTQPLGQFNYNTHENPLNTQYNQSLELNSQYNQYNDNVINEISVENNGNNNTYNSKFVTPQNSNLFNESLLQKANINTQKVIQGNNLSTNSLSTSPSSSTSSTSSQSSNSSSQNNYFSYQNAYNHYMPHTGQSVSHTGHYLTQPNNQYLSTTFPWLPSNGHTVAQNNFLETLTSAAAQNVSANTTQNTQNVPTYDLNSFPYHNSTQVHNRI